MSFEKQKNQCKNMFFIAPKNNRATSQNFDKLSNTISFYAGEIDKIEDFL